MTELEKKTPVTVSEVKVTLGANTEDGFIGWASCVINDAIFLNSIVVYQDLFGDIKLKFPFKHSRNEAKYFYFKPICHEALEIILEAVTDQLKKLKDI